MSQFDKNARSEGLCGYNGSEVSHPCKFDEGWGTEFDSGFCDYHNESGAPEENQNAVGNDGGAPEGNGNAETHGLRSDPGEYYDRQSSEDQERIDEWAESWARRGGYGGIGFDKLFQTHATKLHQIETADDYIGREGVIVTRMVDRTETGEPLQKDEENPAFLLQSRALKDMLKFLKDMGCLDDPDSQKADAAQSLVDILSE